MLVVGGGWVIRGVFGWRGEGRRRDYGRGRYR